MIKLVWAQTQEGIIGQENKLPWKIPEEMNFFKQYTTGKTIVMGRKTFEAIGSKPLPNRENIVLSKNGNLVINNENVKIINDIDYLIKRYQNQPNELIVIGGSQIYQMFLPYADKLIVSVIKQNYPGDTIFPRVNWDDFEIYSEIDKDEFVIKKYERKK
ncbi:dihydrofolate reductase [Spiroplasma alleghenense]|uniref:Dihydrofolate reductase n=1 Tax=Spiroplasma alleghenense TaxID=216931 RepID=A0A345Z3U9_9MOLU|nr:dihydrofolate reductase [Spiroplasma alleghenense]AXK51278.1 dihydrofolate reductase [Spiroplasma alleghenense]